MDRLFARAGALGGAAAAVPFTWLVTLGRLDLLQRHDLAGFYDAQAHALLDGHWDIPRDRLGFEAFIVDGKAYTYFGPWPTLLRLPVAALTDRYDGRLTQLSLLAAFAVLMVATVRLAWRAREVAHAGAPVGRFEAALAACFTFTVGAGSVVPFLASRPVVYHEAELWGAAWAVAAFAALLGFLRRPSGRGVALAGGATGLALLTRSSVGIGPVVALGVVLAGRALVLAARRWGRPALARPAAWFGLPPAGGASHLPGLAVALAAPIGAYAAVNLARFGHPWRLPIADQVATVIDPVRPHIFAGTGGSLFAAKFLPTNLAALLRPDGLGLDGAFPWVTFPSRARVVGEVTFAAIDPAAALPASAPLLFALAAAGAVALVLPRRWSARDLAPLRAPALGAAFGGVGVLTIPFVNQRYHADLLPLLGVLGATAAFGAVGRFVPRLASRRTKAVLACAAAVLAAASAAVAVALAVQYQRAYSPFTTDAERAAFVRFQHEVARRLPFASPPPVRRGSALGEPAPAGTLLVLGDCAGVYWSDGTRWYPIERTAATGRFRLRLGFPAGAAGGTVAVAGTGADADRIAAAPDGSGHVRFVLTSPRVARPVRSDPVRLPPDRTLTVDLLVDNRLGVVDVSVAGRSVLGLAYLVGPDPIRVAGRDDADPALDFDGPAALGPDHAPFCRDLTEGGDAAAGLD
ncbi:MAG: hypothetical protein KatS3mg009_2035 [Acidimicrobiia bacterium]|nr:MAG: hypothetical protein KatS3mg009_2035 [Acidimicrobiia bacterium]